MSDKPEVGHVEVLEDSRFGNQVDTEKRQVDDAVGANLELDESSLPPGYFRSKFFVGSMAGIGLGLMAGVAAYGYAAPILSLINADIGPVRAAWILNTAFH
jgi:hypothetical protein